MSPRDEQQPVSKPPGRLSGIIDGGLRFIEAAGNALPHPGTLFALFAFLVVVLSGVFSAMGLSVEHPSTGEIIRCTSKGRFEWGLSARTTSGPMVRFGTKWPSMMSTCT